MSRGVTSAQQQRRRWVWVGLQKPEGAPALLSLPKHLHTVMNNQSIVVVTLLSSESEPLLILTFLPMIINQCQYASLDAQDSRPTRSIWPKTGLLVFIFGEKTRKSEGSDMYTFRAGRFNHRLASLSTPNEGRPVKCWRWKVGRELFTSPCVWPILIPTSPLPPRFPRLLNCLRLSLWG